MTGSPSTGRFPGGPRLIAAIRMAFDPRKITIATVGLILLWAGWAMLDLGLPGTPRIATAPWGPPSAPTGPIEDGTWWLDRARSLTDRILEPIRMLTYPLGSLLDPRSGWGTTLHALLELLWVFAVWGLCGVAIARLTVVQAARMRQPGIVEGIRFGLRSAGPAILAPLCPLVALAFCAPVGVAFGLLYRIPWGAVVAGALLFFPLIAGLIMTLLAAGLIAGWPLIHAAIAAGADDPLDALSRTFSYINQRLGLFVAAAAMAFLAGMVGLIAVDLIAGGVIRLTQWSLTLSGDQRPIQSLFRPDGTAPEAAATAAHHFWFGVVHLAARSWAYSYFWTSAALIYLGLREEVDGTSRTEIDPPAAAPRSSSPSVDLDARTAPVPEVSATSPARE